MEDNAYKPVPFSAFMDGPTEVDWIVDGVVPRTTTGIIAGEPGVGKTWILMDLVLTLATGTSWLGQFETQPCKILFVDEENAHVLVRRRMQDMLWKYEKYGDVLDNIEFLVGQSIDITPLEHMTKGLVPSPEYIKIRNAIALGEYDVVVFDSLTRMHHADENDSSRMSAVFKYIKMLMDDFGVSCIFTHHFNKGRGHNNNRLRGSSDILAFPDYVLRVDTDRGHTKIEHNGVVIEHGKSRWGQNVGKMHVKLEGEEGHNEIVHISINDLEEALLIYLGQARTLRDILKEMEDKGKGDSTTVQRVLDRLVRERKLYKPSKRVYQVTGVDGFDDLF